MLINGDEGFIMCGYLNMEAAKKLGATAAIVSGLKIFEDMLNAEVKAVTSKTKSLGVEPGSRVWDVMARWASRSSL